MAARRYALITGASGGIGVKLAEAFASSGFCLYLHYNRNQKEIDRLKAVLIEQNPHLTYKTVQADLSVTAGVDRLCQQLSSPVDVLVHNSGNSFYGLVTDMNDEQVQRIVQLHLTSPFLLTKKLLPDMIRKKSGKIVVISSVWGVYGAAMEVLYSAVKGGLNTFVKALAKEVAPSGITVNGIAPGAIQTKMLDHLSRDELSRLEEDIPAGRLGKPEEVAELARFLASEKANYINGEIVSVDGAWF